MKKVTVNLPDELHKKISSAYGEDAISSFAIIAIEELVTWINAEERPTSISEIESNRIFSLYDRILKDLLPTAEDIGQSFNLPMGRSRYIVQSLNYKYPAFMKRRRIAQIIAALELGEVSDDGLPIALIPKECDDFLYKTATELYLGHKIETTPKRLFLSESVRIELGANDRKPLLEHLRAELAKLPD